MHNKIVELVVEMLELNITAESREKNKARIDAIDLSIDRLVYKLYNLTEEEIFIIDNSFK